MVPITAAGLKATALKVQADLTWLLLPLVLETCALEARRGALGCLLRMDKLLATFRESSGIKPDVCPVEVGRALCRDLGKLGFASQVGKHEDDRAWERLCLEVSWKEVVS